MTTTNDNFDDFSEQEEVAIKGKPQIKQFKKWDIFIWYINAVNDRKLRETIKDKYGNDSYLKRRYEWVYLSCW